MSTNGENIAEDADMADCEGEKVMTMMDVLQEQQEFEDDANAVLGASDDKNCTYTKGYIKRQAIYACLTCCADAKIDPTKRAGVCLACSLNCHENHELIELYTKRNFRCDCGNPKFNGHPCQFVPNKPDLNEDNSYNQNFSGLYCTCHRPYPDPDAAFEDEMIQCIVCEDWLHSAHLETSLPANYAEMVCKNCMEENEFLHDYSDIAVNNETDDVDVVSDNTVAAKTTSECNGSDDTKNETDVEMAEISNGIGTVESVTTENIDVSKPEESVEKLGEAIPEHTNNCDDKESANDENIPEQTNNCDDKEITNDENIPEQTNNCDDKEITNDENISEQTNKCDDKEITNDETVPEPTNNSDDKEITNDEIPKVDIPSDTTSPPSLNENKSEDALPDSGMNEANTNETEDDKASENTNNEVSPDDQNNDNSLIESIEKLENELGNIEPQENIEDNSMSDKTEIPDTTAKETKDETQTVINEKTETEEEASATHNSQSEENIENKPMDVNDEARDLNNVDSESNLTNNSDKEKTLETVTNGTSEDTLLEEEPETKTEENSKDFKRKLSTEESGDLASKKAKFDEKSCVRPRGIKRRYKGATFWPSNFRQKLCTCNECLSMYKDMSVLFLIESEDTVTAYEALGKERIDGTATSQYEKGLEALFSLDRVQQINALTEYNKMRDKLLDYLKSFKERKEIVKEEDIKAFFAGMKPKRESDGVYFCR